MPSAALDFRRVCGGFVPVYVTFMLKRARQRASMRVTIYTLRTKTDGVLFGVLLCFLFWRSLLQQCGDIETNPGPPKLDNMRQTRLASGGRRLSADRTDATQSSTPPTSQNQEPTLTDVMAILNTMNSKFDSMKEDVKVLSDNYVRLQEEVKGLREEVADLRQENKDLQTDNDTLKTKMEEVLRKTDDLECRSKRNNLIFYGLPREENETGEDCEATLKEIVVDKLELAGDIEFDRVHRLNSKSNSPVIARCTFFKDKVKILKAKGKLRGSQIFIGEDFSPRVRELRRKLTPHLKKARDEKKKVTMVFDHLVIEGKRYTLDGDNNLIVQR